MQLSALLVILPLASALPQAPSVEARAVEIQSFEARADNSHATECDKTRDSCFSACKPSFFPLTYLYCVSRCNTTAKWCHVQDDDDA